MNVLCKLLIWSCLCCLLAIRVQAQENEQDRGARRHHPAADQLLHETFYSKWRMPDNPSVSCCNEADCYPTEIKYVGGDIYAKRREDGKYIPVPLKKWSAIETIPMAGTTSAPAHKISSTRQTPCSASHWEAQHEIHPGEW